MLLLILMLCLGDVNFLQAAHSACRVKVCKIEETSLYFFHSEFQVFEDAKLHKPSCAEGKY